MRVNFPSSTNLVLKMKTIEDYTSNQKDILFEFLEKKLGQYQHNAQYYSATLQLMADNFLSGLFSSDDVSMLAEEIFVRANTKSEKASQEIPDIFFMLLELEWDLRNNPERLIATLEALKKYSSTS